MRGSPASASASGALREPGEVTAWRIPQRASSSTNAWIGAYVRLTGIIGGVEATVVFVPGFMQRGEAWEPIAARLGARYRSVCLDFTTWTFEERVAEILAATPPGAALVGYSMGGRLALHAALREPARLGALVLVGVSAGIEDRGEQGGPAPIGRVACGVDGAPLDRGGRRALGAPGGVRDAGGGAARAPAARPAEPRPAAARGAPAQRRAGRARAGLGPAAASCAARCCSPPASRTAATRARRAAWPRRFPSARVRLVADAGHAPQLEAPSAFGGATARIPRRAPRPGRRRSTTMPSPGP